jgi:putative transcriptional regulator
MILTLMDSMNLTHHFLIAMPGLHDPNFYHTVTYICSHNEDGAMGIVINKPLDLVLGEVLEQMDINFEGDIARDTPIYDGGPVQSDRGFILHKYDKDWESSLKVSDQIGIATSLDILDAIANGEGPENSFIALGYAGWSAGQLEQEMRDNIWLSGPAESHIIFNTPVNQRWNSAAKLLGIDIDQLSPDVGHA